MRLLEEPLRLIAYFIKTASERKEKGAPLTGATA